MDRRIIDLSEEPSSLSIRYEQLVIRHGEGVDTVPLEELGVLIVAHPAVCYTQAVLAHICNSDGMLIICGENRMPIGMLLPLLAHSTQSERLEEQIEIPLPVKKRLWRQIIHAKIISQGHLLNDLCGDEMGLCLIARKVRSGDPTNLEAQAARRYWPALFGPEFRRIPGADNGLNRLLNYGYAILRAVIARALCGSGLHPSLGIHHHNRYDPFCLADDIMEPYRTVVDAAVFKTAELRGPDTPLNKETKSVLIGEIVRRRFMINEESRTLFDLAARTASSLANVYSGKSKNLIYPEL